MMTPPEKLYETECLVRMLLVWNAILTVAFVLAFELLRKCLRDAKREFAEACAAAVEDLSVGGRP